MSTTEAATSPEVRQHADGDRQGQCNNVFSAMKKTPNMPATIAETMRSPVDSRPWRPTAHPATQSRAVLQIRAASTAVNSSDPSTVNTARTSSGRVDAVTISQPWVSWWRTVDQLGRCPSWMRSATMRAYRSAPQ